MEKYNYERRKKAFTVRDGVAAHQAAGGVTAHLAYDG